MASGAEPGDRVAVWGPNAWEWAVVALGVHSAGCVLVPINTRFKAREAAFALRRTGARRLFTVTDFLDMDLLGLLRESDEALPSLEESIVLRGGTPAQEQQQNGLAQE